MRTVGLWLLIGVASLASGRASLAQQPAERVVPLIQALDELRGQGYDLVYSTDLVRPEMTINWAQVDLDGLRRELPALRLELVSRGGRWLVVAASPARSGAAVAAVDGESAAAIETVIVTGSRHRLPYGTTGGSVGTLTAEDLAITPALGGDAMRGAVRLPGVSTVGVSAKPQIRGGLDDELLVMMDGVELLDPFHLADYHSVFSVIDEHTVGSIDVYTGGFPARYGNRMSGVMDIHTLDQSEKPRAEIGISAFSLLANARGGEARDTPWLVSVRRGNLDLLAERIDSTLGEPRYFDGLARVGHRISDAIELSVGSMLVRDDVVLQDESDTAVSRIDTGYLWSRLDVTHNERVHSSTVLSYTRSDREKRLSGPDEEIDLVRSLDHDVDLQKVALRSDVSVATGPHRVELGAQLELGEATYDSVARSDRAELADLFGVAELNEHDIHVRPDGLAGGVYAAAELELGELWTLLPGIRWDALDYDADRGVIDQVSARLGLRYTPTQAWQLRFDAGRFHQAEALHEMQVSDGFDRFTAPQHADHWIAGAEWRSAPAWTVRAEVYGKRYPDPKPRFENAFNPFVLLPEVETDRIPLAPDEARVEGVDLEVRRAFSSELSFTARYSAMDASDRINGAWVPRRWSQRHTVNAIVAWQTERTSLAGAVTWHSGWRTSSPPSTVSIDAPPSLESLLNNATLRDYLSFDIRASRWWSVGRSTVTLFVDIVNVANRHNTAGLDYDIEEVDDVLTFSPDREGLLPIVPSIGVLIAF